MIKLCFTFDYELFFGENNSSYKEVLFDYTYNLIDSLERMGITATFFADVCSIPIAKKYNQNDYVEGFKKQICYMVEHGQDVQLHLHPHWFNATMIGKKWKFVDKGYRLHDYLESGFAKEIVDEGIAFLNNTLQPVKRDYVCNAFRAGGFSLQPHNEIVGLLYDKGICVDSSIAPYLYTEDSVQCYDYRHKIKCMNWHISEQAQWWEDCHDGKNVYEIPVATINKSIIPFLLKRIIAPNSIKLDLGEKRGTYISLTHSSKSKVKACIRYLMGYNAVSLDAYTAEYLYSQLRRMSKRKCYENQIVAIIGHPKLVTNKYLANMEALVEMIKNDSRFKIVAMNQEI